MVSLNDRRKWIWRLTAALCCAIAVQANVAHAVPVVADSYSNYVPGNARADFQIPSAALGNLNGDTGFGGLTPFNPPFSNDHIVIVGEGGSLTLHLSTAVPTNGKTLGIYVNNGYLDVSADGSGQSDAGPSTFATPQYPQAQVSVSQDGSTWKALKSGNVIDFPIATNVYTDTSISNYFQPIGTMTASQSKPYLGDITTMQNKSYTQIRTAFNNSAGGNWLDLSNTGLVGVNYVKFDVPAGAGRMVVDAVGGLGAARPLVNGGRIISEEVGAGSNSSHVVVDFGPQSYDFIVHYNGSITGQDALGLLNNNTDFRLTVQHFGFGDFVTGLDYGGFLDIGDGSQGNNWWNYYTGNGATWLQSGIGAGSRVLSDGSYDGWVWQDAQTTPPDFAVVPEPATATLLIVLCGGMLVRRRR